MRLSKIDMKSFNWPSRWQKLQRILWRRKYLLASVLLLGMIGLLAHIFSAPVKGHSVPIDTKLIKHVGTPKEPVLPAQAVQSSYFSLALPSGYRVQASGLPPPNLLYQQTMIKSSKTGSLIISIAIKDMPGGGLSGDSGYNLRVQQASRYRFTKQILHQDTVSVANDAQSAAIVAFWPHGAYLATIAITEGVENPAFNDNNNEVAALKPLLAAWQWQP